jgi:hypothetical protein
MTPSQQAIINALKPHFQQHPGAPYPTCNDIVSMVEMPATLVFSDLSYLSDHRMIEGVFVAEETYPVQVTKVLV